MNNRFPGFWPAITLFFLAPAIGELLSGSSPPAEFFNPFILFLLAALYGSGAILVRELRLRWRQGWLAVFLLGAAYGIIEEGWMVKSFFDPNWVDLGLLGSYGRWAGVNWVWALGLTIYHATFSITIPILLVELAFPKQSDQPWLGRKGRIGLSILFLADVAFGFLFLTPYRPPLIPYLLGVLVALGLIFLTRRLPAGHAAEPAQGGAAPKARWFLLLGFGGTLAFFFALWALPSLGTPVLLTLLAMIAIPTLAYWLGQRMSRSGEMVSEQRLALAGGALGFFILLAPLQELDASRPDNTAGTALVGLLAALLLVILWRRVKHNHRAAGM